MANPLSTSAEAVRCAIYARKSSTDGLELEQNSLAVQHDICSAYIRTQQTRKWCEAPKCYQDGGYSGGNLNRPAMIELLADIQAGLVDVVVIYKLDRLTRSLSDFVRLIDMFEEYGVTFVSVTQAFDTRDSMGRLVLNILLTFAQFEREMLADRIRDKQAAMKRAGRWSGGPPPFGYELVDKKLLRHSEEAPIVQHIFQSYLKLKSENKVALMLQAAGVRSKVWITRSGRARGGKPATPGLVHAVLSNPIYLGEVHFRGGVYAGQHKGLITNDLWQDVQRIRAQRAVKPQPARSSRHVLLGLMHDEIGRLMRIESGRAETKYRYYISDRAHRATRRGVKQLRAHAAEMEATVLGEICAFLRRRFDLSGAIHANGVRHDDAEKLLDRGGLAARHLETFTPRRLRLAWEALIDRVEISRSSIRIILRSDEIVALLRWSGHGVFRAKNRSNQPHCVVVLETQACAVRSERQYKLPIEPQVVMGPVRRPFVELFRLSRALQSYLYEDRTRGIGDASVHFRRSPGFLARVLRLTYLAPDIIASVLDGTQPAGLTRHDLLYSGLPTDWPQQRAMLGFPARLDPMLNHQPY